jgi:DinB superfamily
MNGHLTIPETEQQLLQAAAQLHQYCTSMGDAHFFNQPAGKWSAAQQLKHLITSTNTARLAYTLPKFIVRIVAGRPNRLSRTYDELVARYTSKLEQGGKASKRFIPKPVHPSYGREKLLNQFTKAMEKFAGSYKNNCPEPTPDQYLAPHPLLGKITLRELAYFTIHHTHHHLQSIKSMTAG